MKDTFWAIAEWPFSEFVEMGSRCGVTVAPSINNSSSSYHHSFITHFIADDTQTHIGSLIMLRLVYRRAKGNEIKLTYPIKIVVHGWFQLTMNLPHMLQTHSTTKYMYNVYTHRV